MKVLGIFNLLNETPRKVSVPTLMTINGLCTLRVLLLPGAQRSSRLIISVILPVVPGGGGLNASS